MPALPLVVALLAAAPAAEPTDEELAPASHDPSVALGPAGAGRIFASAEIGWLRSGIGGALGAGEAFDVTVRADAFLLKALLREQKDVMAGVRWAPLSEGLVRLSVGLELGTVLFGGDVAPTSTFALRGEAAVGLAIEGIATPYVRGAVRLMSYRAVSDGMMPDEEVGGGVERAFGRFVVGAEAFVWARPGLLGLAQWRIRAGRRF